jgi:SMODS and SLOG-associating 2TM effector domain 1/Protein of unknown function (DUF4231)
VQSLWDEHAGWSRTADMLKSRRVRWGIVVLVLTICGATFQTLTTSLAESWNGVPVRFLVAGAATIVLALVPFLSGSLLSPAGARKWLRARSVSEGIKSEVYTYRAGAEPYDKPDALTVLQQKVRSIRDWAKDLERERAMVGSPTKVLPPPLDSDGYLNARVYHQINQYYRPQGQKNAKRADLFQKIGLALAALVAVLSAFATMKGSAGSTDIAPWIAVLTTIGGSVAAYAAGARYEFQATTFYATARQLADLAEDWIASDKQAPSKEWSEFVRACEEAISAENRGWMAKLDEQP